MCPSDPRETQLRQRRGGRARLGRRRFLQTVAGVGLATVATVRAGAADPGAVRWRFGTQNRVYSSPTVVDGTVYVGSHDRRIYAIDAESGEQVWEFETEGLVDASPTVVDGTVYVGSRDGFLYALDAAAGEQLWRFETEGEIQGSASLVGDRVFVASDSDGVYGIDVESGQQAWREGLRAFNGSSLTAAGGSVLVRGPNLLSLDGRSGWRDWTYDLAGGSLSSPTIADEQVFVGDRLLDRVGGQLHATSFEGGDEQWRVELDEYLDSSPTVAAGAVFVGGYSPALSEGAESTGTVYAVSAGSGTDLWEFETGGRVLSSPTVAADQVVVGSWDGNVYGLGREGGVERWRVETAGKVSSSPTVVDGTAYVGSRDGNVYAIETGTGATSEDTRVQLRTLGHHGRSEPPAEVTDRGEVDNPDRWLLGLGGLAGLLSGAGLLYRGRNAATSTDGED